MIVVHASRMFRGVLSVCLAATVLTASSQWSSAEPCSYDEEKDQLGTWTSVQIRTGGGAAERETEDPNEDVSACAKWSQMKGFATQNWGSKTWAAYGANYQLLPPHFGYPCEQTTSPAPGAWFAAACTPCKDESSSTPASIDLPRMDSAVVRAKVSLDLSAKCGKGRIYLCISASAEHAPDGSGGSGGGEFMIPFPGLPNSGIVDAGSADPWESPVYFPSGDSWGEYFGSEDYPCTTDCNLSSGSWVVTQVIWKPLPTNPVTPDCDANSNKPGKTKKTDGDPCDKAKKDNAKAASQDANTQPTSSSPVQLSSGHKLESSVDISFPVTAGTFTVTRSYSSDPELDDAGMAGANWTLDVFQSLAVAAGFESGEEHLWLAGPTTRGRYYLTKSGSGSSATWSAGGGTTWNVVQATYDKGEDQMTGPGAPTRPYATWRVVDPGTGTREFLHGSGNFDGLLLAETDVYGNERRYFYERYGSTSASYPRLTEIRISPGSGGPGSSWYSSDDWLDRVAFRWDLDPSSVTNGKLVEINAKRRASVSSDWVSVERVFYTYQTDATNHLGSPGDLIQVWRKTLVDSTQVGDNSVDEFTQYRYHTGAAAGSSSDERLNTTGAAHQLRLVIAPQQIEYFAQQYNTAQSGTKPQTQIAAASALLALTDETASAGLKPIDLASKIVSYYTSGTSAARVKDQYLQTSCGCSGSSQGLRESYTYLQDTGPTRSTAVVGMHRFSGSGFESTPYRRERHDLVYINEIAYTLADVIEEVEQSSGNTLRRWVTSYQYDTSRRLIKMCMPSAYPSLSNYTPATASAAPVLSPSTSAGQVFFYGYNDRNRLSEVRIGQGDLGDSIDAYTRLTTTTYPSTDSGQTQRAYLPTEVKRWVDETTGSNEPTTGFESTRYAYELASGSDALIAVKTTVDLETASQNGVDGKTASTFELYDEYGRIQLTISADRSRTERAFDVLTGRVTGVTRNTSSGPSVSPTTLTLPAVRDDQDDVGSLTSSFTVDLLGRTTSSTTPAGVKSWMRREIRLLPERPNLGYAVDVTLPEGSSDTWRPTATGTNYAFSGPVTLSWHDARGNELRRSTYRLKTYDLNNGAFTIDTGVEHVQVFGQSAGELSRRVATHYLSGLLQSSQEWADLGRDVSYTTTYSYDSLGRLSQMTDAEGGVQAFDYDVLNRRIGVRIGRSGMGSPTLVSQTFFDFTGAPSSAAQGTGDGHVTLSRVFTGESSGGTRDTVTTYDFRGRVTKVKPPLPPFELAAYDNLDRPIVRATFGSDPSGGVYSTADRTTYSRMFYSGRGLNYRSEVAIDPTNLSAGYLSRDSWFDANGRVVASWSPNGAVSKSGFDALGRPAWTATLARPDSISVDATSETPMAIATTDLVLERNDYTYSTSDHTSYLGAGQLMMVTTRRRNHDGAAGTLDASNSVASYACSLPDRFGRPYLSVNYGTNTGSSGSSSSSAGKYEPGIAAPNWPTDWETAKTSFTGTPRKDFVASMTTYDDRGMTIDSYAPGGRVDRMLSDALGRKIATVENFVGNFSAPTVSGQPETFPLTWSSSAGRWTVADGLVPSSPDKNRTTSMVYDGLGNVRQLVAHLPATGTSTTPGAEGGVQITAYDYGTAVGSAGNTTDSLVASASLLLKTRYPNETTGLAGTTNEFTVSYSYNTLGELRSTTDQNGTVHTFTRDDLGRITTDAAATLGAGIDGAVRRIGATYTTAGKLDKVTSYDAVTSGNAVNEVAFTYSSLLQIASVVQDVDSAVNTSPNNTVTVGYSYTNTAAARSGTLSGNVSRLASMTYPDGSAVNYSYASGSGTAGIDDRISRLTAINLPSFAPGAQDLVKYQYVGSNWPSAVQYPFISAGLDRTLDEAGKRRLGSFTSQAQGVYPGWDQFGRVRLQSWADDSLTRNPTLNLPTQPPIFQRRIARDAEGNPIEQVDARPGAKWDFRDGAFAYDGLDRLTQVRRGTASEANWGNFLQTDWGYKKQSQEWILDALGNWLTYGLELDGNASLNPAKPFQSTGEGERRQYDFANQITSRSLISGSVTEGGVTSPFYQTYSQTWDAAGNVLSTRSSTNSLSTNTWTHDAWNRLVKVSQNSYTPAKVIGEYKYNGLHWRIVRRIDALPASSPDGVIDQERRLYYSAGWQMIQDDRYDTANPTTLVRRAQYFWGGRYIDDCVAHRIDSTANGWDSADPVYFHATDEQYSTVALLDGRTSFNWTDAASVSHTSAKITERVRYDAYGRGYNHPFGDVDGDGAKTNSGDSTKLATVASLSPSIGVAEYDADMDFNRDGKVDPTDSTLYGSGTKAALAAGLISDGVTGPDNAAGYCGYTFSSELRDYCVRYRWYDPTLGRWLQRDPKEYVDGVDLYQYTMSMPIVARDPMGLNAGWTSGPDEEPNSDPNTDTPPKKEPIGPFKGFEDERYQEHDDLVRRLLNQFNSDEAFRRGLCGCTESASKSIPTLTPELVKAWLIQETGGNDQTSKDAWKVDPAQVNVPGSDWDPNKKQIGLQEPKKRNEGDIETNLKAAIAALCRKGFGKSFDATEKRRPNAVFDGWETALQRYNGRSDKTTNGKSYSENYRDRIKCRCEKPDEEAPIQLPKPVDPKPNK